MRTWKRHKSLNEFYCWYCGLFGSTIDHFPPQSVEKEYPEIEGWLVRCCQSCNSYLNNSMQPSLEFRRLAMRGRIERRLQIAKYVANGGNVKSLAQTLGVKEQAIQNTAKKLFNSLDYRKYTWIYFKLFD